MNESISGIINDLKSRQSRAGLFSWLIPIIALIIGVVVYLFYSHEFGNKLWLLLGFICVAIFYFLFFNYVKGYYGDRIKDFNKA